MLVSAFLSILTTQQTHNGSFSLVTCTVNSEHVLDFTTDKPLINLLLHIYPRTCPQISSLFISTCCHIMILQHLDQNPPPHFVSRDCILFFHLELTVLFLPDSLGLWVFPNHLILRVGGNVEPVIHF